MPVAGDHSSHSLDCWCEPIAYVLCDECEYHTDDCWKCDEQRLVKVEFIDDQTPYIVVHADVVKKHVHGELVQGTVWEQTQRLEESE